SLGKHFESISRGVIDSRDLIYYLSIIGFFVYLNIRKLQTGKWK
ncbi:ABC transporter, partial [Candidatus Poribacteria bacterium]|nr:ABC transporter [Candidatus Poribacteria bacterium]